MECMRPRYERFTRRYGVPLRRFLLINVQQVCSVSWGGNVGDVGDIGGAGDGTGIMLMIVQQVYPVPQVGFGGMMTTYLVKEMEVLTLMSVRDSCPVGRSGALHLFTRDEVHHARSEP